MNEVKAEKDVVLIQELRTKTKGKAKEEREPEERLKPKDLEPKELKKKELKPTE